MLRIAVLNEDRDISGPVTKVLAGKSQETIPGEEGESLPAMQWSREYVGGCA